MKFLIMLMMAACLLVTGLTSAVWGQTDADVARKKAEKIRTKIGKIGTGEKARIEVELFDNTTHRGYVADAGSDSFRLSEKDGSTLEIKYSNVKSAVELGSGKQSMVALGVIIGAAATAGIFLLWYWVKINNN